MWILLALFSAIMAASRRPTEKRLSARMHPYTISIAVQLLSLPITLIALLIHGQLLNPFHLGPRFWLPLIGLSIGFYPLNALLYQHAIKHGELSNVLPIQSLWPVLSVVPAWLTLHEAPTPLALIGIITTVFGVYALGLTGRALHHPLTPFRNSKSSRYMLIAVLLVTAAGVVDKIAIQASEAIYYSFASTLGAVIVLFVCLQYQHIHEFAEVKTHLRELFVIGTLQGSSYTSYLLALSLGPLAYVTSIRSSSVLIGSLLGIFILKEKMTTAKTISFVLIALGGIVLAIGS